MYKMDYIDCVLLDQIQKGISIEKRPFEKLAVKLSIDEEEIVDRINNLKENGYIRRFGGIFNSDKLGVVSTLVGMKVKDNIDEIAQIINEYEEVTHNYEREDEYNLWFTLMAPSNEELEKLLNEIKEKTNINDVLSLPSLNKHKVQVYLEFK